MMDKKTIIIVIFSFIIILLVGLYIFEFQILNNPDFVRTDGSFTDWNNATNEYTLEEVFQDEFFEKSQNITTIITFYDDSEHLLGNVSVINETHNGKLVVHAKVKLPMEPTITVFDSPDVPEDTINIF